MRWGFGIGLRLFETVSKIMWFPYRSALLAMCVGGDGALSGPARISVLLFQQIPKDHLRIDGHWVDDVTDYAIMIPATELAQKPVFINDDFCYYHERAPY